MVVTAPPHPTPVQWIMCVNVLWQFAASNNQTTLARGDLIGEEGREGGDLIGEEGREGGDLIGEEGREGGDLIGEEGREGGDLIGGGGKGGSGVKLGWENRRERGEGGE